MDEALRERITGINPDVSVQTGSNAEFTCPLPESSYPTDLPTALLLGSQAASKTLTEIVS